jgi:hypothetical protein
LLKEPVVRTCAARIFPLLDWDRTSVVEIFENGAAKLDHEAAVKGALRAPGN